MSRKHPDHRPTVRRLTTIHPITAGAASRKATPLPVGDGDANCADASQVSAERLVLSVDDAAYLLNISRGLAYELVARGVLPAIRLGRRIAIPRIALEELLGTAIR